MIRDLTLVKLTEEDLEILRKIYGSEMIRDFLQFKKGVVTFSFYRKDEIARGAPDYQELWENLVEVVKCFRKQIEKVKSGQVVNDGDSVDSTI